MGNKETGEVTGSKVVQGFICNQKNHTVYSEFHREPTEGSKNRGIMGPMACSI